MSADGQHTENEGGVPSQWILVHPATRITTWAGWPEDVVETLRTWNREHALSFAYPPSNPAPRMSRAFQCAGCLEWHQSGPTVASLNDRLLCDPCLIVIARVAAVPPRPSFDTTDKEE